jgi:glycosyltransferase involved in cell wall biosynthesis
VLGIPPAKTTVIYGGVAGDRLALDDTSRRSGVLFVGRLTPHKGVDNLLRALPGGVELTIVGTTGHDRHAPERDYPSLLRRLARDRQVRFVEAASDEELASLYRRSAVAVLPSVARTCYGRQVAISELLGLSLIEAMAAGTPVIASRLGGLPEVVDDGETGFLVTPGDTEELADRLTLLLSRPDRAMEMGRRGREVVAERFTWEACARRCLDAYAEVLGS